jgi:mono/diheme cytochrome c family protein
MINRLCYVAAIAAMIVASSHAGLAASDVQEGKRIAKTWCSICHAVGRGARPGDKAQPFSQLANNAELSEAYLKAWLANPRPPMHRFKLKGATLSDLLAYLRSLKK